MLTDINITNSSKNFYKTPSVLSNKRKKFNLAEEIPENFYKVPPYESIETVISNKQQQINQILETKFNRSFRKFIIHKKINSEPQFLNKMNKSNKHNKTQKFFTIKKRTGFTSLHEKIDFGPTDYYNLKTYTHSFQSRRNELINNLNRNQIIQSQNFLVRESRIPLIITSKGAKQILENLKKTKNKIKLKASFNPFFHRNSIFEKNNKDNNNTTIHSNFSKHVRSRFRNSSNFTRLSTITNTLQNNTDSNRVIKIKNKTSSTKSLIHIDRNNLIIDNNYENSFYSDNDTNSSNNNFINIIDNNTIKSNKSIKKIISSYIKKNTIISDNITRSLKSTKKNIHENKKKLLNIEKKLNNMKKFEKYTDLYKESRKDLDSSPISNKNFVSINQIAKKLSQVSKSIKIRQKFCKFGTNTLKNLVNQLNNNQQKLNHKLFKIIDSVNKKKIKKKIKEKEIDKDLEVILDKKIKKKKHSTAKQEFSDANSGKQLLEDRDKLRLLLKIGDMISIMNDEVALNLTENILEQNEKSKNVGFTGANKYKKMKQEVDKMKKKYLRDKFLKEKHEIEYKVRTGLMKRDNLLNKYKSVIDRNKLINENDKGFTHLTKTENNSEEKKIMYISKERDELLKLNFYKVFNNNNL